MAQQGSRVPHIASRRIDSMDGRLTTLRPWLAVALSGFVLGWSAFCSGAVGQENPAPAGGAAASPDQPSPAGSTASATPPAAANSAAPAERNILAEKSLLKVLRDGGPLMFPIGVCSFLLLVFSFERLVNLRRGRIIPRPFVKRIVEQLADGELPRDRALELCEQNGSLIARVFAAGLRKWGKPSVEVEQAILDEGERVGNELRKYLRLINGISTVSPLLGLLGTVLGMIQAFDAIALVDPAQDPKALVALGLSEALITTAAGMAVAIPALIIYLFIAGVVDRRITEIDSLGVEVVNCISAEALAGGDRKAARARRREDRTAA